METHSNTSRVGSLLNTRSSTFSASFSGFSMSDIPEVQSTLKSHSGMSFIHMADIYLEFPRVKHNKYRITMHIDPHKFEFIQHILDSESCMAS
ncbi:hypothetical protein ACJMK2_031989 [Sinanodonta woodiana]|uniref:Uncharacterized protein n=1 Tax=Sinanodonta woodiana TaxID=1069815 RepID=A0ABD3X0X6_SINWO